MKAMTLILGLLSITVFTAIAETQSKSYKELLKECKSNSCCEASVKYMEQKGYKPISKTDPKCPQGFAPDMMKCMKSFRWCAPKQATSF